MEKNLIANVAEKIETTEENLVIHANPSQIKEIAKILIMQGARFVHLTAIDFINQRNQIELNYFFSLIKDGMNVIVKTPLEQSELSISSISEVIPAVIWAERECNDLFGIKFEGHPDPRRLVLPDNWPEGVHPLRKSFSYNTKPPETKQPPPLKKPEEGKTVIPIGPFYPSLEEPAYFRLIVEGEEIVDFDYRGFYVHRGIEKLAESALNYQQIPFLAERICGICGFVHSCAYCQAVEKAANIEIPLRAKFIRSMFLELERLHSHLLWVGLAAHIVGFDTLFMQAWRIREPVMYICEIITGNRKTYGINIVGGVTIDVQPEHLKDIEKIIGEIEKEVIELREIILDDEVIQLRFKNVGILKHDDAKKYFVCGPVARASGINIDMRVNFPYAAYSMLNLRVPLNKTGDVWARTLVRLDEILVSINILRQIIENMPEGQTSVKVSKIEPWKEAISYIEAPRGQLFHYVMTGPDGRPYRWSVRAPSYQNYQALSVMLKGSSIADAPLIIGSIDPCFSCTERYEVIDLKKNSVKVYTPEELKNV
ncbi:Ni,Fe-hydrogenase III large subunit [Thermodesulfovibrio aggregans]|uniref:Ni,Fe-hydrogenase III large subunit n=1 Tax=Thermodesulfovibrio aggregans TaxID=86166 RepID=A0A0U9HST3_9BACT|nr:NADH-quinone oxidoreductase subunit C [Thermodesulfovibrio aggregans]GAQ94810.1 Ni,Fe-hydrogenase III large subunit [Thermodesulfovibrio aggregans]